MKVKLLVAAAAAALVLLTLLAFGAAARHAPTTTQTQPAAGRQGGWRPSPLKALTLVSAEPLPDNPNVTVYRLRNASGRGIAGFVLSNDESGDAPSSSFTRLHVRQLDPDVLPPGARKRLCRRPRASSASAP